MEGGAADCNPCKGESPTKNSEGVTENGWPKGQIKNVVSVVQRCNSCLKEGVRMPIRIISCLKSHACIVKTIKLEFPYSLMRAREINKMDEKTRKNLHNANFCGNFAATKQ